MDVIEKIVSISVISLVFFALSGIISVFAEKILLAKIFLTGVITAIASTFIALIVWVIVG